MPVVAVLNVSIVASFVCDAPIGHTSYRAFSIRASTVATVFRQGKLRADIFR